MNQKIITSIDVSQSHLWKDQDVGTHESTVAQQERKHALNLAVSLDFEPGCSDGKQNDTMISAAPDLFTFLDQVSVQIHMEFCRLAH
jgi:hypothetical protein